MNKYLITKINCAPNDAEHLFEIGLFEGAEIEIIEQNHKQICMFLIDQTKFCVRNEIFKQIEMEKVI